MKRATDIVVSLLGLILLSPVLLIVGVAIRASMGSSVLFRQQRPGLHGVPFTLVKFRTMREQQSANGSVLTDAQRLTPLGRFLRRTSLDELPELWNVLVGEMSLVGPRPLLMEYLTLYTPEQARRHQVRPGITGLAQVSGRNTISWEEKFALDLSYVDNQSLILDFKLMLATLFKVIRAEGVSHAGEATMPRFTGSQK